jgi:hypothetical protein
MKLRIVTDNYNGYKVQYRPSWWPFWSDAGCFHSFYSIEAAEQWARGFANLVVKRVDL